MPEIRQDLPKFLDAVRCSPTRKLQCCLQSFAQNFSHLRDGQRLEEWMFLGFEVLFEAIGMLMQ